jgi:hypothetical protein
MHVRIGVTDTPKELDLEMADDTDAASVRADVEKALAGTDGLLWLTDRRGRQVGVPVARVAYVDIAGDDSEPRIGFGS